MPVFKLATQYLAYLSIAILASSCGGTGAELAPTTVGEAIKLAEKRGDIPTLNHDSTLLGPDVDGNGVRDDIDAYVDGLAISTLQKAALKQSHRAIAASLVVDKLNRNAVLEVASKISDSNGCLYEKFDPMSAHQMVMQSEKFTVNTKARYLAYAAYNQALAGSVVAIKNKSTCEISI